MRKEEFKKYLIAKKGERKKRFSESTADERVRCCATIEKEFLVDLEKVVQSETKSETLLKSVARIKKTHANNFLNSLSTYFVFAKEHPNMMPQKGADEIGSYISYSNDVPASEQVVGLCAYLEMEYYKILDFVWKLLEGNIYRRDLIKIPAKLTSRSGESNFVYAEGSKPYIVISFDAIGSRNWREYTSIMSNRLFFEYIKYIEYACCKREKVLPFQNPYLSEAVADFSAMLYSVHRGRHTDLLIANRRYDEWVRQFGVGCTWHNAHALYFCTVNGKKMEYRDYYEDYLYHGSVDKVKNVFDKIHDSKNAVDIMVNA